MSSHRLRSTLYHAVPKPDSRPAPLWQIATALNPAATVRPVPAATAVRGPATSAVPAGWVCVGIGLLTAWFFPLAHVFFSIAILLSVVAMVTHQVRAGLLLLAGALAGIVFCVVLMIFCVSTVVVGALHHAGTQAGTQPIVRPSLVFPSPAQPRVATGAGNFVSGTNTRPLAIDEVTDMLAAGRRDDEIIAATTGRPLFTWIGPTEITSLRAYGASERLIGSLRDRRVSAGSSYVAPTAEMQWDAAPSRVVVTAPAMPMSQPMTSSAAMTMPVDYSARDRRIAYLKQRIEEIDETIRRVRADPHYYGTIKGSTNTALQQSSDAYLDQLDKQRNDLRREKWALEGR